MTKITPKEISDFYDEFVSNQKKIGVSIRHRLIFNKLKSLGLKPESNVLEVGCGIGTVSSLIISHCRRGIFLGCDISPNSIRYAQEKYGNENVRFEVQDMSDFSSDIRFDFIVFPDVLEHIPVESHSRLFENVSAVCKPSTKVLINIPEPKYLDYIRIHYPKRLQIIDQSLSMLDLMNNTYPHGFEVESIQPYRIHTNVPNYLSIVLIMNKLQINEIKLKGKWRQLVENIKARYF